MWSHIQEFLNILDSSIVNVWDGNIDHSATLPLDDMKHAQEMQDKRAVLTDTYS